MSPERKQITRGSLSRETTSWIKRVFCDRTLLILLGAGLVTRLVMAIPVFVEVSRTASTPDGFVYDELASNLLGGHGYSYSYSMSSDDPYTKNSSFAPGYPFFVAGIYALFGHSRLLVVLIHIVLNLITLVILYRFINRRFGFKHALWMGVFFIADLNMALFLFQETTETLFILLFIPALILILESFESGRIRSILGAGALLGAATLVRSITLYFAVPLLIFIFLSRFRWRKLLQWGILLAIQIVFITPWIIRNKVVFGEIFYTTVADLNLFRYQVVPLKALLEKKSRDAVYEEFEAQALEGKVWQNEAQYHRLLGREARSYVLKHPLPYVGSLVVGGVASLIYPLPMGETRHYFRGQGNLPKLKVRQSLMFEVLRGRVFPAVKVAWQQRVEYFGIPLFVLFIVYTLFYFLKLGAGLRAYIVRGLRDPVMLLFLITGLYFLGLLGFGISPRMRVPLEPLLASLAGIGIVSKRMRKQKSGRKVSKDARE